MAAEGRIESTCWWRGCSVGACVRRLFLQEQLHAFDARVGMEAPDHAFLEQIIAQREQDHSLVVHHIAADHGMAFAGLQAFGREIHRFIKP